MTKFKRYTQINNKYIYKRNLTNDPVTMFTRFIKIFILGILLNLQLQTYCQQSIEQRPRVGLVLSGGAARGLAHIGVLKVLEKAGLPIDMVGGTSMGSIVGGLYAAGYSAGEIEKIVLSQDWTALLTDQVQRSSLSVVEKEDYDKYLISVPFKGKKILLPSGLGAGQNVSLLLSQLTFPVDEITDFSKLPRPFFCIATNIVSGEEVLLDKGYLPDAIRASMAIPTIFTPVEIDGQLLVDGGLVNGFPTDRMVERGADIVIGVNLGLKEYNTDDLKSLAAVLEQSIFIHAKTLNKQNQKLCRVLIAPDVYTSNAASFSNAAALIKIGEDAAMSHFDELKALADSIKLIRNNYPSPCIHGVDSIYVEAMQFEGLNSVPQNFLEAKFNFSIPGKLSVKALNDAIQRAYGTQFFEKISYKLTPVSGDHTILVIRVQEKNIDLLRLGVRYDSQFKTQLLLNATFRNKLIKGSKLKLDLQLGEFPRFEADYRIITGWRARNLLILPRKSKFRWFPGFGMHIDARTFETYSYDHEMLTSNYKYTYLNTSIYASSGFTNAFYFETGLSFDATKYNVIYSQDMRSATNDLFKIYALIKQDSYDHVDFPRKGSSIIVEFDANEDPGIRDYSYNPFYRLILKAETAIPIGKKLTFLPRINTGIVRGDSIPPDSYMFMGGSYEFGAETNGLFQFNGLRFMQLQGRAAIVVGLKAQLEFIHNHYLLVEGNAGNIGDVWENLILATNAKIYKGAGISYGYNSFIGPLKIGFYKSISSTTPWQVYLDFGYRF